ncbi:MAG: M48 family metallopeptidase [Phycisphaerales bacterium]|nr:M48 family metallopeptidase [Phycisphaerales bacterium]
MDFFRSQEVARRKTGRLIVLFVAAVMVIIVLAYVVVAGVLIAAGAYHGNGRSTDWTDLSDPLLLVAIGAGTLLLVGGGSFFKLIQLRNGGGAAVAEGVGGRLVNTSTTDFVERRLLNVVEEMAIASGTPVPPVYLLDEESGINAFAAGFSPAEAVVGVTRGGAERLSRDELQGVIAHEFSHILNGDMRLNIRLIGILHGILVIGLLGQILLRAGVYGGGGSRRSSRNKGSATAVILGIGAGLAVVGFAGTFFGNWIKAAVSRQREFLADASAVQFTRNPSGIAGALKKIGGFVGHARIANPNAAQASHMFFGRALTTGLSAIFSTHPPVEDRIRRIDPSWDGRFVESRPVRHGDAAEKIDLSRSATAGHPPGRGVEMVLGAAAVESLVRRIGNPAPVHVEYAKELLAAIPPALASAAREPFGSQAVVVGLLTSDDAEVRAAQGACLLRLGEPGVREEWERLLPTVRSLEGRLRLPVLEAAIPALGAMSPTQYERFRALVVEFCRADKRLDLFEWCLQRIVLGGLDLKFGRAPRRAVHYYALARLGPECEQLLSVLARVGTRSPEDARRAFASAADVLGAELSFLPADQCELRRLDEAVGRLARTAPRLKRELVRACETCIAADRRITAEEAELLRAVVVVLGCPMPPVLPGEVIEADPRTA